MKQPLNEQFIRMQKLAGIITENQYKEDINEASLSPEEQDIADDILNTLNEGPFDSTLEKIKAYTKKGLMTVALLSTLLASPGFSQDQKQSIQKVVKTEAPSLKQNASSKGDIRSSLTMKLKSTNPRILNFKTFEANIPWTSWNYGTHANADKNNTVGLSLDMGKGTDVIHITLNKAPGKSSAGYDEIAKAMKSLGGKINQHSTSTDSYVSTDKVDDIIKFMKDNMVNITKQ
jgi:hypothetical protein